MQDHRSFISTFLTTNPSAFPPLLPLLNYLCLSPVLKCRCSCEARPQPWALLLYSLSQGDHNYPPDFNFHPLRSLHLNPTPTLPKPLAPPGFSKQTQYNQKFILLPNSTTIHKILKTDTCMTCWTPHYSVPLSIS